METKKLLITGFEPFDGQSINPSWEAVALLPDRIGSWQLTKLRIPVEYENAPTLILEKARELQPDAIISVGQAGGRHPGQCRAAVQGRARFPGGT